VETQGEARRRRQGLSLSGRTNAGTGCGLPANSNNHAHRGFFSANSSTPARTFRCPALIVNGDARADLSRHPAKRRGRDTYFIDSVTSATLMVQPWGSGIQHGLHASRATVLTTRGWTAVWRSAGMGETDLFIKANGEQRKRLAHHFKSPETPKRASGFVRRRRRQRRHRQFTVTQRNTG